MTIFFRNRGEVLDGKKWTATKDWSKEDTQKLPSMMMEQVEAFMQKEEGVEDAMEAEEEDEEGPK